MLLARLLEAGGPHFRQCKLAECSERYLGRVLDKELQRSDWSGALTEQQLAYAARDAEILTPLYGALRKEIENAKLTQVASIEARALPAFVWLTLSGVAFDRQAWDSLT